MRSKEKREGEAEETSGGGEEKQSEQRCKKLVGFLIA